MMGNSNDVSVQWLQLLLGLAVGQGFCSSFVNNRQSEYKSRVLIM